MCFLGHMCQGDCRGNRVLRDAFGTGLSYLWKTQVLCRTDVVERLWRDEGRRRQVRWCLVSMEVLEQQRARRTGVQRGEIQNW